MALSYRGPRPYYRRSVRRGGRVTSEYLGAGEAAVLMAQLDAAERDRRAAEAADRRAEARRLEEAELPLAVLCEWADRLARAALYAAGYHLHKRQWRKRRPMAKKAGGKVPATAGEITALLARRRRGTRRPCRSSGR